MPKLIALLLMVLTFDAFSLSKMPPMKKYNGYLTFEDDLNFKHLLKAIERQEKNFNRMDLKKSFKVGSRTINRAHLKKSILYFKKLVINYNNCSVTNSSDECFKDFNYAMNTKFDIYQPQPESWEKGYKENKTLFTAYYSPDLYGSKTKTAVYKNPIYAKPKDAKLVQSTSDDINYKGVLKNKGLELFYVKESLYDIWLLHVEGGGRVKVKNDDGTYSHYYLSYDSSNKQKFNMLYKYMLANNMLVKGQASIANQRKYFVENPHRQREILKSCPSFIYFKVTKSEPLGVRNIPLTENRSLATDYRRMEEYGLINFVKYKKPLFENGKVEMIPFSRFFINQDTGGAIKGNARSDLYFGYGPSAELSANYIYGLGNQYFLILK